MLCKKTSHQSFSERPKCLIYARHDVSTTGPSSRSVYPVKGQDAVVKDNPRLDVLAVTRENCI